MFVPSSSPAFSRTVEIAFPIEINSVVPQVTRDSNRHRIPGVSLRAIFRRAAKNAALLSDDGSFFAGGCLDSPAQCYVSTRIKEAARQERKSSPLLQRSLL